MNTGSASLEDTLTDVEARFRRGWLQEPTRVPGRLLSAPAFCASVLGVMTPAVPWAHWRHVTGSAHCSL